MSDNTYNITNMTLAAFLLYEGHELVGGYMDTNGSRSSYTWSFKDESDVQDAVLAYTGGETQVEPLRFNAIVGELKRQAMAARR